MTIIDTTLYANGALRLSRHGAGRGGDVLVDTVSGKQIELPPTIDIDLLDLGIEQMADAGVRPSTIMARIALVHGLTPH
jgi:hypothetical protein